MISDSSLIGASGAPSIAELLRQRGYSQRVAHFHLVALSEDLRQALVVKTSAGWLLPAMKPHGVLSRAERALVLLARSVRHAEVVHGAAIAPDPGSFATHEAYLTLLVSDLYRTEEVEFIPVDELFETTPVQPHELQILSTALGRLRHPRAPFDSRSSIKAVQAWANTQLAVRVHGGLSAVQPKRCTRFHYHVRLLTMAGVFLGFRSGVDSTKDAALADFLEIRNPGQFPRTLALDRDLRHWLYSEPSGMAMPKVDLSGDTVVGISRMLALIQKRARLEPTDIGPGRSRTMKAIDLFEQAEGIVASVEASSSIDRAIVARWPELASNLRQSCSALDQQQLPLSIAPLNIHRDAVMTADGTLAFVGVSDAIWSYPFLSLWRFSRVIGQLACPDGTAREQIENAWIEEWADIVSRQTMIRAFSLLPALGALSALLETSREMDIEELELGEPLPHWYRGTVLAPLVGRILGECERLGSCVDFT